MRVRIRFFAALRDRFGATVDREVPTGTTAAEVWASLVVEQPALKRLPVRFVIAEQYVAPSTRLEAGAELAIFPPVSGGVGPGRVPDR